MKKYLLLLFVIILSSCTKEPIQESCNCDKVYYYYNFRMDGVRSIWYYQKTYSEKAICQDATGEYVQIDGKKFYRIECK